MAFQLSPGVLVTEQDLTNVIPAVSTSAGAFVGNFAWGPAQEIITVASENELVKKFGGPNITNKVDFYSAANFLAYTNNLKLVRAVGSAAKKICNTLSYESKKTSSLLLKAIVWLHYLQTINVRDISLILRQLS